MISEKRIDEIITEEISKSDVNSIVANKLSSSYDSREFKDAVTNIVADALENLYRVLYTRSSSWKGGITR